MNMLFESNPSVRLLIDLLNMAGSLSDGTDGLSVPRMPGGEEIIVMDRDPLAFLNNPDSDLWWQSALPLILLQSKERGDRFLSSAAALIKQRSDHKTFLYQYEVWDRVHYGLGHRIRIDVQSNTHRLGETVCTLVQEDPTAALALLNFYIVRLGSWGDAERFADYVFFFRHLVPPTHTGWSITQLCIQILASTGDKRFRLFQTSDDRIAHNPYSYVATQVWAVAAEVVAFESASKVLEALGAAAKANADWSTTRERHFVSAILAAYRASLLARTGRHSEALLAAHESGTILTSVDSFRDNAALGMGILGLDALKRIAHVLIAQDRWKEAAAYLSELVRLSTGVSLDYYTFGMAQLGFTLHKSGDLEAAKQQLLATEAAFADLAMHRQNGLIRKHLALILWDLGEESAARHWLEKESLSPSLELE